MCSPGSLKTSPSQKRAKKRYKAAAVFKFTCLSPPPVCAATGVVAVVVLVVVRGVRGRGEIVDTHATHTRTPPLCCVRCVCVAVG